MRLQRLWKAACIGLLATQAVLAWARLEINQAPGHDLVTLKGIGPSTSEKIIQARQSGPFLDWPDLIRRVKGIGPATAAKLSAQGLRVNGQPYTDGNTAPNAPAGPGLAPASSPAPHGVIEWHPMVPRPLQTRP